MEIINYQQYVYLNDLLIEHDIPAIVILKLLNIKSLSQINIRQYNYLLVLIKN